MLDLTYLCAGWGSPSVALRYGKKPEGVDQRGEAWSPANARDRRPVVVWNLTRSCNLQCLHCYSDSHARKYSGELTTEEAKAVLDDLAEFKVPAILFSGGEPLVRPDIFDLARYARSKKISIVLSTNGTLIDEKMAKRIKETGFSYVGVSLDGIGPVHDHFRGMPGTFDKVVRAFRCLKAVGQKVGLRLTLTPQTSDNLGEVFDFIEKENIDRVCFYHLVPAGRGKSLFVVDTQRVRKTIDEILVWIESLRERNIHKEVLTVDNPCDGAYLYQSLAQRDDARAQSILESLQWNGGGRYSSGVGIADIDFQGNVHPDQFWLNYKLGNVRVRKFSEIWMDTREPLMAMLKNKLPFLKGRCGACRYQEICGGGLRSRAAHLTGDAMAAEPSCYLTDEEIGCEEIRGHDPISILKMGSCPRISSDAQRA